MLRRSAVLSLLIISGLLVAAALSAFAQAHPKDESVAIAPLRAAVVTTGEDRTAQNPDPTLEAVAATCSAASQELMLGPTQLASSNPLGLETELSIGASPTSCHIGCSQHFCRAWCMFNNGSPYGWCVVCNPSLPLLKRCEC